MSDRKFGPDGVLRFLDTARPVEELKLVLSVLLEFKGLESEEEWLMVMFTSWAKFEQFEDMLRLLTNTEPEKVTDEVVLLEWQRRQLPGAEPGSL